MIEINRDKIVRISSAHMVAQSNQDWLKTRAEIGDALAKEEFLLRFGTADEKIQLLGKDGVQAHIRRSGSYVFFGKPTLGEMFKLISLFVGLQTLDPDLHFEENGKSYRRPVIIYGDQEGYKPIVDVLRNLQKNGTIKQDVDEPNGLIRFAQTPQELVEDLYRKVPAEASMHGGGVSLEKIQERAEKYPLGLHYTDLGISEPEFKVIAYTSASSKQDETSISQAHQLGEYLAKKKYGLISGLGQTGLMHEVHLGCIKYNGWSEGSNVPHIIAQEGLPKKVAKAHIIEDIYTRMQVMFAPSDFVVASAGGRGGAGTLQEILGAFVIAKHNKKEMFNDRGLKPVIVDNRLGIWTNLQNALKPFGIEEGKGISYVSGTDEVIEKIDIYQSGEEILKDWR